jgi:diacylglycerol kinase (ATP)
LSAGSTGSPHRAPVYFCNIAGAGLDSEANRRANAMPRWLRANGGYVLAVLAAALTYTPQVMRVMVASPEGHFVERVAGAATLVALANTPAYGHGMRIAPRAQFDDGILDVCFVRRTGKLRLLRLFPGVFSGSHLEKPEMEYFQADRLRLETAAPIDVYADGEFCCRTPIEVAVMPEALRVIVP